MEKLIGSLFGRRRAATQSVTSSVDAKKRLAAPLLSVRENVIPLTFPTGNEMYDFSRHRLTPCLQNMAMQMRIPDDFLEWAKSGGSFAARKFFLEELTNVKEQGSEYIVVGFQDSVVLLPPDVLLPLLQIAARCCSGAFTLLLHKHSEDARTLISPSLTRKSDLQTFLKSKKGPRSNRVLHMSLSPGAEIYSPKRPTTPNSAAVNASIKRDSGGTGLAEMKLLEEALAFCHASVHFLPENTIFMDIVGSVAEKSRTTQEEFCAVLSYLTLDGYPSHPGLGVLFCPHSSKALSEVISLVHFALQRFPAPLVPTPVLHTCGDSLEGFFSEHKAEAGEAKNVPLLSKKTSYNTASVLSHMSSHTQTPRHSETAQNIAAHRGSAICQHLPESNPLSMTLLMIPSSNRDSLLLLVSFLSQLLANIEPRTDFFLMSLVGIFYGMIVDEKHTRATPLFVSNLISGYRQLVLAETSRASRSLLRNKSLTKAGDNWHSSDRMRSKHESGKVDSLSPEWKMLAHALRQLVAKLSKHEQRFVCDLASRLHSLVQPLHSNMQESDMAGTNEGSSLGETRVEIENSEVKERVVDSCIIAVMEAFKVTFQQAAPLLPAFGWKIFQRTKGIFRKDTISRRQADVSILKSLLTVPRQHILEVLGALSRVLLKDSTPDRANNLGIYQRYYSSDDLSAAFNMKKQDLEIIVYRRTLCRILAPSGFDPERVLAVMRSFSCLNDVLAPSLSVGSKPLRLGHGIYDFGTLHDEVSLQVHEVLYS